MVTPGGCAGPQRRAPRLDADSSEVCSSTSDEEDRVFAQQASRGMSLAPRQDASSACNSSGRPSAWCLADASQETSLWPDRSSNGRADAAVMQRCASLVREDPEEHEQSTALRSTDRWDARTHGMHECSAAFSAVGQCGDASAEAGVQKLLASRFAESKKLIKLMEFSDFASPLGATGRKGGPRKSRNQTLISNQGIKP
mgnify:CR=1 FL=1